MTHTEAIERKLVEKYLLSDMGEAEREEFELHFFSCPACAADLKDGAMLIDSAKQIFAPVSKTGEK